MQDQAIPEAIQTIEPGRTVVAVVIEWRGKVALFKRSATVSPEAGMWHCITGYVEPGTTPGTQAAHEVFEETGLSSHDILETRQGPSLVISDKMHNPWLVHTFLVRTHRRRLRINWEHETYRWTARHKIRRFANRVPWLDTVLQATAHTAQAASPLTEDTILLLAKAG